MSSIEQIPQQLTWKIRHEVMYPEMSFDSIKLPKDEHGIHFGLFNDNQLISVVSTFKNRDEMQFRKFATKTEFQGRGYGTELLNFIIRFAKTEDCKLLWCNALKNTSKYYTKFGFHKTKKIYSKNGYDFVVMELKI